MRAVRPNGRSGGDYAPSRLAWKLERMWMNPRWRGLAKRGLPALAFAGAFAMALGDHERASTLVAWVQDAKRSFEDRPEFAVTSLALNGAGDELSAQIVALVDPLVPDSSLRLDLPALRAALLELPRVAGATVAVAADGVLAVTVAEHPEVVLHRAADGMFVLRGDGTRLMRVADRRDRPQLPLVAGEHAGEAVGEALGVLGAAGPLRERIVGLVRVGGRRWDAVLTTGQRIMLPESGSAAAIRLAAELDAVGDVTARSVTHVDLRRPARPVLRLTEDAAEALHAARAAAIQETIDG